MTTPTPEQHAMFDEIPTLKARLTAIESELLKTTLAPSVQALFGKPKAPKKRQGEKGKVKEGQGVGKAKKADKEKPAKKAKKPEATASTDA